MATIESKVSMWGRVLAIAVGALLALGALAMWGCSDARRINQITAPTADTPGPSASTASQGPATQPGATEQPGQAVGAEPGTPAPENCSETDPKKWKGFSWSVEVDAVTMRNSSTCDRVVTWRAFVVRSDSDQPPAGNAVTAVIPAGAGYGAPGSRLERPWVLLVHYSTDDGKAPCGVIQIDGRAGIVPNMTHANASFTPGRLFTVTGCFMRPTPPSTPPTNACVDPGFGPWVPVQQAAPALIRRQVHVCEPMERRRTLCSGLVQVEPRPADWCFAG